MTRALFWVYEIDWRTRAINVVAEVATQPQAQEAMAERIRGFSDQERIDFATYKTMEFTPVSDEMLAMSQAWRRGA